MIINSPSRGYKDLPFFKQSEIIYDFTVEFCKRYIDRKSRTKDQMEQAARSGKQNAPEGYLQQTLETRIRLLGVCRGSLEELLNDYLDYLDYLRQHGLSLWDKDDPRAKAVRALVYNAYNSYKHYKDYLKDPESACNAMICLIKQTNQLLDQKIRWLKDKFINEGGFRENLFKQRMEKRNKGL